MYCCAVVAAACWYSGGTGLVESNMLTGECVCLAEWRRCDVISFLSSVGAYNRPTAMASSRQVVVMMPAGQMRKARGVKILFLVAPTVYVVLVCWFCRGHTCYMSKCTIMYLCTFNKTGDGGKLGE